MEKQTKENLIKCLNSLIDEIKNNDSIELNENTFEFQTILETNDFKCNGMIKKYLTGMKQIYFKLNLIIFDEKIKTNISTLCK